MSNSQPKAPRKSVGRLRGIRPQAVQVVEVAFTRVSPDEAKSAKKSTNVQVDFEYAAWRKAQKAVDVQLTTTVAAAELAKGRVVSRSTILVDAGKEVDLDVELARVASQIGPVLLYPYARELIADLSRRAGIAIITLPVYEMGRLFRIDPEELKLTKDEVIEAPAESHSKRSKKRPAKT